MQENSLQSQVPKTYLPFHLHTFWDSFYKNHIQQQDSSNINWYFDLTTFSTPEFSLKKFSKEDEILLVGAGLSSTLDYFDSNGFDNITIFDFSEELANILKNKYNKGWDIMPIDIRETKTDFAGYFNVIGIKFKIFGVILSLRDAYYGVVY